MRGLVVSGTVVGGCFFVCVLRILRFALWPWIWIFFFFLFYFFSPTFSRIKTSQTTWKANVHEERRGKIRIPVCDVPLHVFAVLHLPFSYFPCHHVTHLGSLFIFPSLVNSFRCQIPSNPQNVWKSPIFAFIPIAFHFNSDKHRAHRGRQSIWIIMGLKHLKAFGHPDIRRCKGPGVQESIMFCFSGRIKSQVCLLECLKVCMFRPVFYMQIQHMPAQSHRERSERCICLNEQNVVLQYRCMGCGIVIILLYILLCTRINAYL